MTANKSDGRRRVVITGIGVINPMGNDVETMWNALKESKSGVGPITIFEASGFPTQIAAEIKDWDVDQIGEDLETWKPRGRHTRFAVGAAQQAVDSSGIDDCGLDPIRLGVYLGCGEGNQDFYSFSRMMEAGLQGDTLDWMVGRSHDYTPRTFQAACECLVGIEVSL